MERMGLNEIREEYLKFLKVKHILDYQVFL